MPAVPHGVGAGRPNRGPSDYTSTGKGGWVLLRVIQKEQCGATGRQAARRQASAAQPLLALLPWG